MRRNCNLELRLLPPSSSLHSDGHHHHHHMNDMLNGSPKEEKYQRLTIFYDGRVSACDVTELQARAIISLASQEMEEKSKSPSPSPIGSDLSSPLMVQSQILGSPISPSGLSMKRSLQRFLQKRKHRIQSTSPYH